MAEPTPVPSQKPTFPARLLPLECAFVILMWIHPDNRILTGLTILAAACLCGFLFQFRLMDFRHGRWCSRLVHLA
ncbi:MAG: hypothetical protein PHQ75_14230, partial [Thermoguttaceae bacterium]|nr:hypothetical protein [Thermoguttaceae bacterium]